MAIKNDYVIKYNFTIIFIIILLVILISVLCSIMFIKKRYLNKYNNKLQSLYVEIDNLKQSIKHTSSYMDPSTNPLSIRYLAQRSGKRDNNVNLAERSSKSTFSNSDELDVLRNSVIGN